MSYKLLTPTRVLIASAAVSVVLLSVICAPAQETDDAEPDAAKQAARERKEKFTKWMEEFAGSTKIVVKQTGNDDQPAKLIANPVFRYSDEERFIPDATLWVWTLDGRPTAFQKVEGNDWGGGQGWTICFASLSPDLLKVEWPVNREFETQKPGVEFAPIPRADPPSDKPRTRTLQIKELKDRFSGRLMVKADGQGGAETRFMAKPIFEYAEPDSKLPRGAVFGMSSTGTNPDLLLLIEARPDGGGKLRWEYAHARLTSASLIVRLDDDKIWSESATGANNTAPGNWIYFFLRRSFK